MRLPYFISFFIAALLISFSIADAGTTLISKPGNYLGSVGWWTFDGDDVTSNGIVNRGGSGNTGYYVGAATSSAKVLGQRGQALRFDGGSTYVDVGTIAIPGAVTLSAWVKISDLSGCSGGCEIVSNYNAGGDTGQFELNINNTGNIGFSSGVSGSYAGGYTDSTPITQTNKWYHIVLTRSSSTPRTTDTIKIYVDGVSQSLEPGFTTAAPPTTSFGKTSIGRNGDYTGLYFPGAIDEVRIFDRALSTAEVVGLHKSGSSVSGSSAAQGSGGLNNGLVGYWTLDGADVSDKVYDRSGNTNNGYYFNGATSTAKKVGKIGQAMNFSGVQAIEVPDHATLDISGNGTIAAWIKRSQTGTWDAVLAKGESNPDASINYNLEISDTNGVTCTIGNGVGSTILHTGGSIDTNWHHVACVWDGVNIRTYLDGLDNGSDVQTITPAGNADSLGIGEWGAGGDFMDGLLDDVRLYNRALTAVELKKLYLLGAQKISSNSGTLGAGGLNSGLVGHWTFDGADITSNVITDKSGRGNNGGFFGGATSSAKIIGKMGQAIKFDGVNDYVQIASSSSLRVTYPFTIATWVKVPNFSNYVTLVTTDNDHTPGILAGANLQIENTTGKPVCGSSDGATGFDQDVSDVALTLNKWQHVTCVVRGADDNKIYIDGSLVTSANNGGAVTMGYANGNPTMGDDSLGNSFFTGSLDDVRVYNRALTPTEVKQLYNLGK